MQLVKKNILVAGSGNITGINIIKALNESKNNLVVGCDFVELNPANKYCRNFVVPKCNEETYFEEILEIIDNLEIKYIFTSNDHELRVLTKNISKIKQRNVYLNGLSHNTLILLNKVETNKLFVENDILTPQEYSKSNLDFPVVIRKNEMGNGPKFVYIVYSTNELHKIPNRELDIAMYTEYIDGQEFTIDIICCPDSKVYSVVPRLRRVVKDGMVFFAEIVKNEFIIKQTIKLAEKLKLTGVNCVQCIFKNNQCYFFEVNPRPGSGMDLTTAAGINMPQMWIDLLNNRKIKYKEPKWGLKMIRYFEGYYFK